MKICKHCSEPENDFYIDALLSLEPEAREYVYSIILMVGSAFNQEGIAKKYYFANDMYDLLTKAIDPDDFVSTKEIRKLLNSINEKKED